MSEPRPPLVGVIACTTQLGLHPFNIAGEKYLRAVINGAGAWPLIIPSLILPDDPWPPTALLERLDGLLFTGSPSNVAPVHYQSAKTQAESPEDHPRDATSLPLIRAAIAAGVPLLGICRGFQEMNVALGGSLHQAVADTGLFDDHREDKTAPLSEQYGPAHDINLVPGGLLAGLWPEPRVRVNSLHGQGIARLAPGLRAEAYAEDGLLEAFSVAGDSFALGVQFHPEWQVADNPFYLAIFQAFGAACRARAALGAG
ncbi:gamma-glutamyl-gamma-aminobutyrate hydrolase family protein [Shewanella cyperi]|uniref:gamma-glutamyl-gamma-aminobutyrate hydrolase family protein n=1 Tax=Shewanella cyperi TaxID=2814292 RepID=UPI001A940A65|nr:gamma-glutamyl-gamma-aminobutyrate hydrolase family protein [Shewanella cyperi]QSX41499.1 gamma-glutamyl-gamma-aminobutyrate hydrolase family protein [Shewanella cyperi]